MIDIQFIILAFIFLLVVFFSIIVISKKRKVFHETEEVESEDEVHEYEYAAKEHETAEGDTDNDIRDINNKRKKKLPYQPKNYRGTDIEIAGFESKKDLKALHRDDLETIDIEELVEDSTTDIPKPVVNKEVMESGISSEKGALETTLVEIKQNYLGKGETSAITNFESTASAVKKAFEKAQNGGNEQGSGGRSR